MSLQAFRCAALVCLLVSAAGALAQETVFNVPSGDILDRGKIYGELDVTFRPNDSTAAFTPRIVLGVSHRIEVGLNVSGLATRGIHQTALTPAFKWKAYDGGKTGWAFLIGDDLFIPIQNRTYAAGNYVYGEFTKTWTSKTRATLGAYHFTRDVVASSQRAGGQFAIEQPIGKHFTLAADWYTGHHAFGYVTPGFVLKIAPSLTLYVSYQVGNSGVFNGNRQLLIELGWNLN